jgi:glutathione-regulated potassium-efflux system ancillary protein KefC/glutathione-regulated potassium-efflux system protein KefB
MNTLQDVTILLAAGVIAVSLFKRLGLGSVLGYLAAGLIIGPFGLRLVTDVDSIMHVSELGIVLLLFLIGLELEPSRLWVLRRQVFGLGGLQIVATTLALALLAGSFGLNLGAAVTIGFALSLSSTAFVLQIMTERRETLHAHGRSAFAILLFQDLAVIPFLALIPLFSGTQSLVLGSELGKKVALVAGAFVLVGLVGAFLIRPLFRFIALTKSHDVFTAAALLTVIGTALCMQEIGLSMSLGAFLAGVLLATSEYRHEIQADIAPFEGLLLGLFFMAVGMAANLRLLIEAPLALLGVTVAVMLVKGAVLAMVGRTARLPKEAAMRLALALPQGGEFAFVLFTVAMSQNLLSKPLGDFLVMVVTLSMALTPVCFGLADRLGSRLFAGDSSPVFDQIDDAHAVIIAGFGRFGQIVARLLRMRHIKFTALEINQEQVDFVRKFGNKLYYGDASRLDLLRAAAAEQARVFVLAIDDVEASMRTAALVKRHFPHLKIIARARNRQHLYRLLDLGIDASFRETFTSSLEAGEATLVALGATPEQARADATRFRAHDEDAVQAAFAVHHDEKQLIETAKHYAKELESLFEADRAGS